MNRVRTLFLSDIHLGTRACQAKRLLAFLRQRGAEAARVWFAEHPLLGEVLDRATGGGGGMLVSHHPDEPFVHDALIDALSELATPDAIEPTPALAQLLAARGRIWLDVDELDRARRELTAAERIADAAGLADPIRYRLTIALAELAVRSGDRPRARALVDRALGLTRTPELAIERLRRHPRLADLVPTNALRPE